jgi:hypothetical protein
LKTGTVEILRHVEITPTVSKYQVPVGAIIISKYESHIKPDQVLSFVIIGKENVYKFITKHYLTIISLADYKMHTTDVIADNLNTISYLKERAQVQLDKVFTELDEGIFDND